jgi:small-conductance mechanosensitive channel
MLIIQKYSQKIVPWIMDHGIKIVVILTIFLVIRKFLGVFVEKILRRIIISDRYISKEARDKREGTLVRIFTVSFNILVLVLTVMMVMQELGIAIGPLLTAAGIVGLALGFGGQYLIRDLIAGFFIILENQYRIGDVVNFETTAGLVEDISLRMTTLRDLDGVVHHVPHGEIKRVSNLSKDFARVNLNVNIAYNSNLEHVIEVVNQVGQTLANDPEWGPFILTPPAFLRVDDFGQSALVIKILGDTLPLKQWDVSGELRKRLKMAFDQEHIEIPLPQRVVHQGKWVS